MFRMIAATIASFFNVIRINMDSLANVSAAGNIISLGIVEEQLNSVENIDAVQARLQQMGLSTIVDLPKPKARANKRVAQD
jgi:hypothetical protein